MKDKSFKTIASCLGIIVPTSLLAATDASGKRQNDGLTFGNEVRTENVNKVSKHLLSVYNNIDLADAKILGHTNTHADRSGEHTNQHSDVPHSNSHTDTNYSNQCPDHTNFHSDYSGGSSHTDYNPSHANKHVDRQC